MSDPSAADIERRTLAALRRMRERIDVLEAAQHEPLAIVGAACRFPGAENIDAFWSSLMDGGDSIVDIPPERWDVTALAREAATTGVQMPGQAGLLSRIDGFDAEFFGIAGREARLMDPQQRMFLEVAWEALERAGIPPLTLNGSRTGVFVGTTTSDYLALLSRRLATHEMDAYIVSGNTSNATAGRVSYTLGLHGPAMAIDTACSSSLVAIDRACRSVRDGESRLAIAGGVNLVLAPELTMALARWGMLAPDARCKVFDASADGFVRGEGCGVVLIKRLSDARADGDRIWALVRGSAVNQAGASGAFAVPNGLAQAEVLKAAVAAARIDPTTVGYLEAHGTGTSLGDPIEMEAISTVYGAGRPAGQPLWVGSVKSNVGHLEAAAGVAGFIKTVLALRQGCIPPNLHFREPSQHIPWASLPVHVPTRVESFPASGTRRLAAVSAFGFSGTNAHVILEEAPEAGPAPVEAQLPALLVTVSARSDAALSALAERHADRLEALADAPGEAAAYCLATASARSHLAVRLAATGADAGEVARRLRASTTSPQIPGLARGRIGPDRPGVAFLFSGQGAQHVGMGRRLAEVSSVFREALEHVATIVDPLLGRPLLPLMFGEGEPNLLSQTRFTQPALFAIEVALVEWWRSVGVVPSLVLGHSVGEFSAAWAAGVLTLEEAAKLVTTRGALMQALPGGGAMAAVMTDEATVQGYITALKGGSGELAVAGINGPAETVVAGPAAAIQALVAACKRDGHHVEPLTVSHAFHSPLMEPMIARFAEEAQSIAPHAPSVQVVSSTTGAMADSSWGSPAYWQAQLREPVRWFDALRTACESLGTTIALEIGPSSLLTNLGRRGLPKIATSWLPSLRRGADEAATIMSTLGDLYVRGAVDDWSGAAGAAVRSRVDLPTYPFQHRRFWPDEQGSRATKAATSTDFWLHPMLGSRLPLAGDTICFQALAGDPRHGWVREHSIGGTSIWPAAASLEMLLAASWQSRGRPDAPLEVMDVELPAPLRLLSDRTIVVQTMLQSPDERGQRRAIICQSPEAQGGPWPVFASGLLGHVATAWPTEAMPVARATCHEPVDPELFYRQSASSGADFGPHFRRLGDLRRGDHEACARLLEPDDSDAEISSSWLLHPAQLDAALQLATVADDPDPEDKSLWVPVRIECARLHASARPGACRPLWGHARLRPRTGTTRTLTADIQIWRDDGTPLAVLDGVHFVRRTAAEIARSNDGVPLWCWDWEEIQRPVQEAALGLGTWTVVGAAGGAWATELASTLSAADEAGEKHVVCLAGFDLDPFDPFTSNGRLAVAEATALFDEVLAVLRTNAVPDAQGRTPRLWIVTRGAQAVTTVDHPDPRAAALWGLARVIRAEQPESHCTAVDIEANTPAEALAAFLQFAASHATRETQLALRAGVWWRARLAPLSTGGTDAQDMHFVPPSSGRIEDLAAVAAGVREPGSGEVSIDVQAAGLNFRDVLATLGMVKSPSGVLGGECAGRVRAVGPGVQNFAPGDSVMALAFGGMATRVNVPQQNVAPRPRGLSIAEAAALPIACLTASYGFEELAGLRPGQRVLIHAATGGVGLAAVQLAQLLGAEVYATAGSEAKRALLRRMGVSQVFDSRSLVFASDARAATGGAGFNVVLNSLAGEFIEAGLGLVEPGGCFLEMGKRDIWPAERVAARFPGIRYHAFDLGDAASADATLVPRLFGRLAARLGRHELRALPVTASPMSKLRGAIQTMAQARHVGKLVLNRDPSAPLLPSPLLESASYLVTGGFGAVGLQVAEALAERGARHIILLGRSAPSAKAEEVIERLAARGVKVYPHSVDVADLDALRTVTDAFTDTRTEAPLRGVVHAAGIIDDAVLTRQDGQRLARVLSPKLAGAMNLVTATAGIDLDFLVLFCAGAAWLGNAGQANYAAANSALEALAETLRGRGRTATAIAWGRWAGPGMAEGAADWLSQGIGEIAPEVGTATMFDLLARQAGTVGVLPIDWPRYLAKSYGDAVPACFERLTNRTTPKSAAGPTSMQLLQSLPPHRRREALQELVVAHIRSVTGLDPGHTIDPARPLRDLGLDSLMAVELRNFLGAFGGRTLPATLVFDHPTLDDLTDHLLHSWRGQATEPGPSETSSFHAIAALSEEEAEAQLLAELAEGSVQ